MNKKIICILLAISMLFTLSACGQSSQNQSSSAAPTPSAIGTLHCKFDNGRSLSLIPSEDSFRKLTEEELAEEQEENLDMDEDGPSMRM